MAKILLKQDHITFSSADDISQICKPLIKLGITSFNYVRTYDDGSQINLSNTPEWLEHFYKNEFYHVGAFERHPESYESGYALWPHLSGQKIFYDARTYFDIDNGITIIEKQKNCCDFFYFGSTTRNKNIINLYLNNIDLLKRFILYFREAGAPVLRKAENNKIILPDHFSLHQSNKDCSTEFHTSIRDDFLKDIPIKKFALSGTHAGEVISSKQANCLIYMLEGKTAKEIAKLMGISYRTVEGHVNKLKERFCCNTKSELISRAVENGLGIYSGKCNVLI